MGAPKFDNPPELGARDATELERRLDRQHDSAEYPRGPALEYAKSDTYRIEAYPKDYETQPPYAVPISATIRAAKPDGESEFCPTCQGKGEVEEDGGKQVCPTCLGVGGV